MEKTSPEGLLFSHVCMVASLKEGIGLLAILCRTPLFERPPWIPQSSQLDFKFCLRLVIDILKDPSTLRHSMPQHWSPPCIEVLNFGSTFIRCWQQHPPALHSCMHDVQQLHTTGTSVLTKQPLSSPLKVARTSMAGSSAGAQAHPSHRLPYQILQHADVNMPCGGSHRYCNPGR